MAENGFSPRVWVTTRLVGPLVQEKVFDYQDIRFDNRDF